MVDIQTLSAREESKLEDSRQDSTELQLPRAEGYNRLHTQAPGKLVFAYSILTHSLC